MVKKRQRLKKTLGRVEVFSLAFGTMVGWACFVLPIQWINSGGILGTVISLSIATVMCLCVGLTYAELTSAFPVAGGELAFAYRSMGYTGAWITGWVICMTYICVSAWEGIALPTALNYIFPLEGMEPVLQIAGLDIYFTWTIAGVIGAVILTILNIIGVRQVAIFQILLLLVMVVAGIIYFLGGLAFGSIDHIEPIFTDVKGLGVVLIMAPSMFIGFDMASKSAEEMNMPLNNIAKVLTFSICMAGIWYILMSLTTFFLLPSDQKMSTSGTVADVAAHAFQSAAVSKIILIGGIAGIITSWNGFMVGASRIIFAMSRAKMLPKIFSFVHPQYKTPVTAILFVGIICGISPALGEQAFVWLVHVAAFGTTVSYLMVSISFLIIRRKEPELRREYRAPFGKLVGIASIGCALFFLFWFSPISSNALAWPNEWGMVCLWILLGVVFFAISKISEYKRKPTPYERETLIYSEEYARDIKK